MLSLSLDWTGDLTFRNSEGSPAIDLHSSTRGVSSPPQALAYAVMACMGMDVVHVVQKARHTLQAMRVRFEGERAAEHPRRFVSMTVHFDLRSDAPQHVVERAIDMSREKYCSVWNTIRPDVELRTTCTITRTE